MPLKLLYLRRTHFAPVRERGPNIRFLRAHRIFKSLEDESQGGSRENEVAKLFPAELAARPALQESSHGGSPELLGERGRKGPLGA